MLYKLKNKYINEALKNPTFYYNSFSGKKFLKRDFIKYKSFKH